MYLNDVDSIHCVGKALVFQFESMPGLFRKALLCVGKVIIIYRQRQCPYLISTVNLKCEQFYNKLV